MRVLIHSRLLPTGRPQPVFSAVFPHGLDLENVSEAALSGAAAHLGKNDLLPLVLVTLPNITPDLALLRSLRGGGFTGAILVLTPANTATAFLNAGADDVMMIPADPVELLARLSAVSRRSHGIPSESVQLNDLRIYLDGRHPEFGGQVLQLSAREYQILRYLALNVDRVVTKAAIYDALYALCAMPPFDKIIDVYICRLRRKFGKLTAEGSRFIQTVPGRGYRLTAPAAGLLKAELLKGSSAG